MGYGIMRVEKRGRAAVFGLQIEANRTQDDHAKGRDFDRSDIDWDKTGENIHLIKTDNWNKAITEQIKAAGCKERKDSIVMLDGLYTASPEWMAAHSRQEQLAYFRDCLDFHVREFCGGDRSRVLNAVIHFDETTPHMQVASVPICEDEKGLHLSAKIVMGGRTDYQRRQDRFFEQVTQSRGLERGETDTGRKHHELTQKFKLAKREQEIAAQDAQIDAGRAKLAAVDKSTAEAEKALKKAQRATERETDKVAALASSTLGKLKPVMPNLFGEKHTVTFHENMYNAMCDIRDATHDLAQEIKTGDHAYQTDRAAMKQARQAAEQAQRRAQEMERQQAQIIRERAQEMAQTAFDRMSRDARQDWQKAKQARQHYEQLRDNAAREIDDRATEKFQTWIDSQDKRDLEPSERRRMEAFMDGIRYRDGSTVLDRWEQSEQERVERLRDSWDWER